MPATAAAAAVFSVMSDSVLPQRWQPTRLPCPWDSPGKNTGVGCRFLLQCMKVKSESEVTQSCPTLATPWTTAYQAPPSMEFSRQESWSGLPFPSPVDLPDPGIEPRSPHCRQTFYHLSPGGLREKLTLPPLFLLSLIP